MKSPFGIITMSSEQLIYKTLSKHREFVQGKHKSRLHQKEYPLFNDSALYEKILPEYVQIKQFKWVLVSCGCYDCLDQAKPAFTQNMSDLLILNVDINYCHGLQPLIDRSSQEKNVIHIKIPEYLDDTACSQLGAFLCTLRAHNVGVLLIDSCGALSTMSHIPMITSCIPKEYGEQFFVIESYFNEKPVALLSRKFFVDNSIETIQERLHHFHTTHQLVEDDAIVYEHISMIPSIADMQQALQLRNNDPAPCSPSLPLALQASSNTSEPQMNTSSWTRGCFIQALWQWILRILRHIEAAFKSSLRHHFFSATAEDSDSGLQKATPGC